MCGSTGMAGDLTEMSSGCKGRGEEQHKDEEDRELRKFCQGHILSFEKILRDNFVSKNCSVFSQTISLSSIAPLFSDYF